MFSHALVVWLFLFNHHAFWVVDYLFFVVPQIFFLFIFLITQNLESLYELQLVITFYAFPL